MRVPSQQQLQLDARLLLAAFSDLPPMHIREGVRWLNVYVSLYFVAHDIHPPAADLLTIRKEILHAHERHLDHALGRGLAWARLVSIAVGGVGALTLAAGRL